MEPIEYKGFTIKEDTNNPYMKNVEFIFFPTEEGECHDYGDFGAVYMGNCKWADSIEECKELIDELLTETI